MTVNPTFHEDTNGHARQIHPHIPQRTQKLNLCQTCQDPGHGDHRDYRERFGSLYPHISF